MKPGLPPGLTSSVVPSGSMFVVVEALMPTIIPPLAEPVTVGTELLPDVEKAPAPVVEPVEPPSVQTNPSVLLPGELTEVEPNWLCPSPAKSPAESLEGSLCYLS